MAKVKFLFKWVDKMVVRAESLYWITLSSFIDDFGLKLAQIDHYLSAFVLNVTHIV